MYSKVPSITEGRVMNQHAQYLSAVVDKKNSRVRFTLQLDPLLVKSMVGRGGLEALLDDLTSYVQTVGRSYGYNDGILNVSDDLSTYPKAPSESETRTEGLSMAEDINRRIKERLDA